MKLSDHAATDADAKFWKEMKAALVDGVSNNGLEYRRALAVASKFVGMLLACQDQRAMTSQQYMEEVAGNIQLGNKEFIQVVFGDLTQGMRN